MVSQSFALRALVGSCAVLVLVLGHAGQASAQSSPDAPSPERVLVLDELLQRLLLESPELHAASARVAAAAQLPDQAASLPDPSAGLVYRNVGFPEFTLGDQMMSVLGVRFTQELPGMGKRPQRRTLAESGVDVAGARVDSIRRRLIQQVASAYYELGFTYEAIGIVDATRQLLLDLEETAEARYAVGVGIQQDVLKGQVEISILLNRLVQLEQQRDSIAARINRLIGLPASAPLGRPAARDLDMAEIDPEAIAAEAVRASAVLVEREQRTHEQEEAVQLARLDRRPDFMLSGSYMNRAGLPGIWEVNVGLTLPIRKGQRQDRAIAETLQELNARRADQIDASQAVDLVVRDSYLRADRAARLTSLYRDAIVPQAVLSLESALAGYSVGNVDFLTVLDNVVTLLTYRLELEREAANYATALVGIEEHLGRSLGATPDAVWRSGAAAGGATFDGHTAGDPAMGGGR